MRRVKAKRLRRRAEELGNGYGGHTTEGTFRYDRGTIPWWYRRLKRGKAT